MIPRSLRAGNPAVVVTSLLILWGGLAGLGAAQVPRGLNPPPGSNPQLPSDRLPPLPGGLSPAAPVPVIPDTAWAELEWPEDPVRPIALAVVPDTVLFGDVAGLVFQFPPGSVLPAAADLGLAAEWLSVPEKVAGEQLDRLAELARSLPGSASDGERENSTLLVPIRVYRSDPFGLVCGQIESAVIPVRGRTTDLVATAPIRDPRQRGWNLLVLAVIALVLTLCLYLAWRLLRHRIESPALLDWDPSSPAWIATSGRLRDLLESGVLDQGRGREFLNELAAIARGFAAERYRIAAREMTGQEIVSACLERGFPVSAPRRLARLIEDADWRRYDPEPVDSAWCRKQAGLLIDQIAAVRIIPRQTPVSPEVRLGADKAWTVLQGFQAETRPRPSPDWGPSLSRKGA